MSLVKSIVLAVVFALAGSFLWAIIQFKFGLLAGPVAYGIGWGAGIGVAIGNGRKKSPAWGALAVAVAVAGVAMAKVCVVLIAQWSGMTFDDVGAAVRNEFDWLDVLWFALAIWPAWMVGSGRE